MSTRMRQYILDVAGDLFARQGINATSVDKIVAQAQIAKVTLYKYFTSKELLIVEYLKDYDAKLWKRMEGNSKQENALADLQEFINSLFDLIGDKNFKGFASINAAVEFPASESIVHQTSKEFSRNLRSKLSDMARKAGLKNSDTLAMQLQLIIEGTSISDISQGSSDTVKHAKEMARILIQSSV
jgi:AcrR family transcriptional regulator